MNHLTEVVRVLKQSRDPRCKTIDSAFASNNHSTISKLYRGLLTGVYKSDSDAAQDLYGSKPDDIRYATVKTRLRRKALNSLILLNPIARGFSMYTHAQYQCHKGVFIVQTLLLLGARRTAVRYGQYYLRKCQDLELTSLSLELMNLLRLDSSLRGDQMKFEKYTNSIRDAQETLLAESEAWQYCGRLDLNLVRSAHPGELSHLSKEYEERLDHLSHSVNSFAFALNRFRVQYYSCLFQGNFRRIFELSDKMLKFLGERPYMENNMVISEIAYKKLGACLHLRAYDDGREAAEAGLKLLKEGSNNWFYFLQQYLLLSLHTFHFEKSAEIVSLVINHPRFSGLPSALQEGWRLNQLYVNYAFEISEDKLVAGLTAKSKDPLQKLLELAPTLSQDKQGHKVSLLILHILYLLEIGDFNGIIDRMEALKLYRARYLKTAQFPKTAAFFKLLSIMENNSFSYKLVKEKSEKTYEQLIASSENQEEINEGLQILPYDWLWQKILERLKEYELKHA